VSLDEQAGKGCYIMEMQCQTILSITIVRQDKAYFKWGNSKQCTLRLDFTRQQDQPWWKVQSTLGTASVHVPLGV
jgi:hypothetical protein